MTRLQRHDGYPREDDVATERKMLLQMFYLEHPEVEKWTNQVWPDHLQKGSGKKKIAVLLGLLPTLHAYYPRPFWREQSWSISAGQCGNSVQLDWLHLSRWFFPWQNFYYSIRSDCRRRKIQNKDDKPYSSQLWNPWTNTRRRTLRRERATVGTLPNEVVSVPECIFWWICKVLKTED